MSKLIINFKAGEYSKNKTKFKNIFTDKYKWDKKSAWIGDGYVKATQKMKTGAAVTFLVETDFADKFTEFCDIHGIDYQHINSFDGINVAEVKEDVITFLDVKICRTKNFVESTKYFDCTSKFALRWYYLLHRDDERLNKILANPELDIPIDTIFEKEEEEMFA